MVRINYEDCHLYIEELDCTTPTPNVKKAIHEFHLDDRSLQILLLQDDTIAIKTCCANTVIDFSVDEVVDVAGAGVITFADAATLLTQLRAWRTGCQCCP